jgi:hypothetical protein
MASKQTSSQAANPPSGLRQAMNTAFTQIKLTWQYFITAIVISQQTQRQAYLPVRLHEHHRITAMQMTEYSK